jgi:hypothetical protein
MKGISHFAAGVALASCFPRAVAAGADGNPLYFILGGVFGLLADTMDFKLYRFLYRHDVEIQPDPLNPDPQLLADAVAAAIDRAGATGRPVRVKLDTVRLGADLWQQYEVRIDVDRRRVIATFGPVVNTSGKPEVRGQSRDGHSQGIPAEAGTPTSPSSVAGHALPALLRPPATLRVAMRAGKAMQAGGAGFVGVPPSGGPLPVTDPSQSETKAEAKPVSAFAPLACGVKLEYEATTTVDILDGPVLTMEPTPDGRVMPRFIPWHREWSHSLVIALLAGLLCAAVWDVLAGAIASIAYAAHVLADQLGFMGSSLFFPFRTARTPGLKLTHSMDALPNLATVWLSCLVIFWNLNRAASPPIYGLNPLNTIFYGALLPLVLILLLRRVGKRTQSDGSGSA